MKKVRLIEILVRVDSTSDSSTDSKPSKSSMDSESTDDSRDSKSSMDSKSTDDSRDDKEGDGEGDTRGEETAEEEEEEEGTHLETSSTHSQLDISRHCSEDPEPNTLHVSEANECGLGLSRTSPRGFSNPLIARIA